MSERIVLAKDVQPGDTIIGDADNPTGTINRRVRVTGPHANRWLIYSRDTQLYAKYYDPTDEVVVVHDLEGTT